MVVSLRIRTADAENAVRATLGSACTRLIPCPAGIKRIVSRVE